MSNKKQCTCDTPFIDCPHAMEYPHGDKWYCSLYVKRINNGKPLPFIIQAIIKVKGNINNIGFIKCPKCGSDLTFVKDDRNGQSRGKCKDDRCISWAE